MCSLLLYQLFSMCGQIFKILLGKSLFPMLIYWRLPCLEPVSKGYLFVSVPLLGVLLTAVKSGGGLTEEAYSYPKDNKSNPLREGNTVLPRGPPCWAAMGPNEKKHSALCLFAKRSRISEHYHVDTPCMRADQMSILYTFHSS